MLSSAAFTAGFGVSLSLILAIGAQNAFVLRQGIRNEHVLPVVLACALSDAILISFGVGGFREILAGAPWIDPLLRYGGAAFLAWYGACNLRSAFRATSGLAVDGGQAASVWRTLGMCLAITWLNPHVYLDTVVLIGTISTQFPGQEGAFAAGATSASFVFFFVLGFGARYLRPFFALPRNWRVLEGATGLLMWAIAASLVTGG